MDLSACVVTEFVFSAHDMDSKLVVMCKGKRIHISLTEASLGSSPALHGQYLHYLEVAEAYELDGVTVDDFYDWVLEACLPQFLVLPSLESLPNPTLKDYLFPETLYYTMRAVEEKLVAVRQSNKGSNAPPLGIQLCDEVCSEWPVIAPEDVYICASSAQDALSRTPGKVYVGGEVYFFKPLRFCDQKSIKRELQTYKQIRNSTLDSLRISRLYGLVRGGTGVVFGLLLRYIDARSVTLTCAVKPSTPEWLRQRWANEIGHILSHLHEASIVWGDVKPDNVLIDAEENAWVIDFGGGYTEGWVEKELAETKRGDKQGLAKILSFLSRPVT